MSQIYNPYLPLNEYVPDGEPRVFGNRVYIYGSHDSAHASVYCPGHYVTWSASVEDLTDWRYEGVIYKRNQDPSNADDTLQLWAPDATQGPDGRYYIYYCFNFRQEIGVAVADTPIGPFEFYGHVKYPNNKYDGKILDEGMPFDPAVLCDEDGRVYLYYGFAPAKEKEMYLPDLTEEQIAELPDVMRKTYNVMKTVKLGEHCMVVELEQDMITVKSEPKPCIPGGKHTAGTAFDGHGYFEAPSIRKIRGRYYLVYSSHKSHELCYAVSNDPMQGFEYGGVVISNGDIGFGNRRTPVYPIGNNHGGLAEINGKYYIFYHRQTAGTEFSRQGCAEEIAIDEDGRIRQVEITSSGLNGKPLVGKGIYPASICSHLTCRTTMNHIDYDNPVMRQQVRVAEDRNESFITDVDSGTVIGYKNFSILSKTNIMIEARGSFNGVVKLKLGEINGSECRNTINIQSEEWQIISVGEMEYREKTPIYFEFDGQGKLDIRHIVFV